MTVQQREMFYVACDAAGCDAVCPPADFEVIAWESYSSAEESAIQSEWHKVNTLHFCPEHRDDELARGEGAPTRKGGDGTATASSPSPPPTT